MDYVNLEIEDGISTIEFFTKRSNSLPSHMLNELAEKIRIADSSTKSQVIVLKSGGEKVFCAGASFDELIAIENENDGKKFFMGFARVINEMKSSSKLIISSVQGKAVGGGLGLVAASDYSLATSSAAGKLSELSIGIGPFVVGPAIERKMGKTAFTQMTLNTTHFYPADWLQEKGLYSEVLSNTDELELRVGELAKQLATYNPEAMKLLKMTFWEGTENWDTLLEHRAEMSGRLVLSDFTRKTLQSFKKN